MKIAFPTDDGKSISRHFGQAKYFRVITLENGQPGPSELRKKATQLNGNHDPTSGVHPDQQMVDAIDDCQVLIAGGMGSPAYNCASNAGLEVILTREAAINLAVLTYLSGKLENEMQLIHAH